MNGHHTDILIIGGGVLGISIALETKRRYPGQTITVLEKESRTGMHASGRNSGVLHAGFYYSANSLKARFCRDGNREWTEYCLDKGLKINRCGKLVVARNASDLAGLDELLKRSQANGIELQEISAADAREIEPRAKTFQRALFSPTTASVDPQQVMAQLTQDAISQGVIIHTDTQYLDHQGHRIRTNHGSFESGYTINAAGLYADKIAHRFGFGLNYQILPFKGLYLYSKETPGALSTHIYPVPELDKPFLGTHLTVTVDGHYKIGPTATPAFWREQYEGLHGLRLDELSQICRLEAELLLRNSFNFRQLAFQELKKYNARHMVAMASDLVAGITPETIKGWGKPGIRAQLINRSTRRLEMDFCWEGDRHSFHLLNAVSPAFTCALPLARYCLDKIETLNNT